MHLHKLLGELEFQYCVNLSSELQNVWVLTFWKNLLCRKLQRYLAAGKNFKTAAKSVERQALRKHLSSGSRKRKIAIGGKKMGSWQAELFEQNIQSRPVGCGETL